MLTSRSRTPLAVLAALTPIALGQSRSDVYVSDSDGDKVWFCTDSDGDGAYLGANEVQAFYDDQIGPFTLSVNAGLWRTDEGVLFVTDSTEDIVLRLEDRDGNGDAHGLNEATIWFDGRLGGNLAGVVMTSGRGMWRDPDGVLWVASSNTTAGGNDAILRLEDLNGDGDANDLNESREYYVVSPGGSVGNSIPAALVRGADGALYYADNGTAANPPRGIYRLVDVDGSGVIDQPNEVSAYFLAPAQGGTAFHWELSIDPATGAMYLNDTGNDLVWRVLDANGNGTIDPGEETLYWDSPTSSNVWDIDVDTDGSLYLVEDQTPDRLLRLFDTNGDGSIDPVTEVSVLYDDTLAGVDLGSPRALAVVKRPLGPGTSYCGPAANNSTGSPAVMSATGSASLAANDLELVATGLPTQAFAFFLTSRTQGFIANPAGSQGNLCLAGSIGRYVGPGQILNSGTTGEIQLAIDATRLPTPSGLVIGQVGEQWNFTTWFRDAIGGAATSNFADGYTLTWLP